MVKSLPAMQEELGSIPGWGRSPGEGNGNLLQYSCLGNPMDRGAWLATVHGVAKKSDTTEQLTVSLGGGESSGRGDKPKARTSVVRLRVRDRAAGRAGTGEEGAEVLGGTGRATAGRLNMRLSRRPERRGRRSEEG